MKRSPGRPRADLPTIVLHWLVAVALAVSLGTGLRISLDALGAVWSRSFSPLLPQGAVSTWHLYSAYALTMLSVAYLIFLWRAQVGVRVRPDVRALHAPERATRWRAINRLLYWVAFGGIAAQAVTGALLYFVPGLLPVQRIAALHRSVAWALIAYVGLHVAGLAVSTRCSRL